MLTRVWNKVLGFTKQYMKLSANTRFTNRKLKYLLLSKVSTRKTLQLRLN